MIEKGKDTDDVIQEFSNLEEIPTNKNIKYTEHVGIYDFSVKLRQWKVKCIKQTIDEIEQDETNEIYYQLFDELKKFVTGINITVWYPEFLPFNYILLTVVFDKKILEDKDSYGYLRMLLLPIIRYCRLDKGLITSDSELNFPMYYQLYYKSQTVKPTLNKVYDKLNTLKKNLDVNQYVNTCNELKKYFKLEEIDKDQNIISLLKIQEDFFILGNMGQVNSDIFNVFSLEPDTYQFSRSNPFFISAFPQRWPFPQLFLSYLISVTLHLCIDMYHNKLKDISKQVNVLKEKYRNNDKVNDNSLNPLLLLKRQLNYFLLDLTQLENISKIFKDYIVKNPEIDEKSIVVVSEDKKLNQNIIKNKIKTTYIHALNDQFEPRVKSIKDHICRIDGELKFLQGLIEPLQQRLLHKNNSKITRTMIFVSSVTLVFAIIVGIDVIITWLNP